MRHILLLLLIVFISCNSSEESRNEQIDTRHLEFTSSVAFIDHDGNEVTVIDVVVADDDESRSEGLMNVHSLPGNSGMLFIFDDEAERSFWMANTPLSLDIIYANSDFEIVRIHRNTQPYSNDQILSELPAKYVVEVNAGFTLSNDITEGMFIKPDENILF